jgi:hypothetical protein
MLFAKKNTTYLELPYTGLEVKPISSGDPRDASHEKRGLDQRLVTLTPHSLLSFRLCLQKHTR